MNDTFLQASPWSTSWGFGYFHGSKDLDFTGSTMSGTLATPIAEFRTGCANIIWPTAP